MYSRPLCNYSCTVREESLLFEAREEAETCDSSRRFSTSPLPHPRQMSAHANSLGFGSRDNRGNSGRLNRIFRKKSKLEISTSYLLPAALGLRISFLYCTKATKFSRAPSALNRSSGNFLRSIFLIYNSQSIEGQRQTSGRMHT